MTEPAMTSPLARKTLSDSALAAMDSMEILSKAVQRQDLDAFMSAIADCLATAMKVSVESGKATKWISGQAAIRGIDAAEARELEADASRIEVLDRDIETEEEMMAFYQTQLEKIGTVTEAWLAVLDRIDDNTPAKGSWLFNRLQAATDAAEATSDD